MTVLERFEKGDLRALSRLVSYVENRENGYRDVLTRLHGRTGKCVRIGLTGPPGAGKSTIVNALSDRFLKAGKKVGIIAVDPTSPFTGGALLGDRVRMEDFPTDGTFYFRSMATRGATGGLAGATDNVGTVYDAFGFDVVIMETVGVGQVELDVIDLCDTVVVALVPESGDSVQTMKAGLMEIADLFCINKADRPGADRIADELRHTLGTRKYVEAAWEIPIYETVAVKGEGIDDLYGGVNDHLEFIHKSGQFESHRREQAKKKILNIMKNRFQREVIERLISEMDFETVLDEIRDGKTSPFLVADRLYDDFRPR